MSEDRKYHVVAVNERTGDKTYLSVRPVTHKQGCVWLTKLSIHPGRRCQLEEVTGQKGKTE